MGESLLVIVTVVRYFACFFSFCFVIILVILRLWWWDDEIKIMTIMNVDANSIGIWWCPANFASFFLFCSCRRRFFLRFFFFESVTHWKYCRSISFFFVRGIESDMGRVHKFKLEQMYVRKADCACMTQPLRGLGLGWGCGGFGGVLCVFRLFFLLTIIAGGIFSLHIGGP